MKNRQRTQEKNAEWAQNPMYRVRLGWKWPGLGPARLFWSGMGLGQAGLGRNRVQLMGMRVGKGFVGLNRWLSGG